MAVLTEDFESYSTGDLTGQGGWSGSVAFDVNTAQAQGGTKSVLHQGNGTDTIDKTITTSSIASQSFYIYKSTAAGGTMDVLFRQSSVTLFQVGSVNGSSSARLLGSTSTNIGTISSATWHRIEIEWDKNLGTNGQVRAKFDGGSWSSYIDLDTAIVGGPSVLRLSASDTGTDPIYLDTFDVASGATVNIQDTISLTSTVNSPSSSAGSNLTISSAISASVGVNSPTASASSSIWTNKSKSSAPSWTNQSKS